MNFPLENPRILNELRGLKIPAAILALATLARSEGSTERQVCPAILEATPAEALLSRVGCYAATRELLKLQTIVLYSKKVWRVKCRTISE